MLKCCYLLLLSVVCSRQLYGQEGTPRLIHAGSKQIRIADGDDLLPGELVPSLKPDIYVFHKTLVPKAVTYYTDRDSIRFEVVNGVTRDFAIVLNGRDTCWQRITSINPNKVSYSGNGTKKDTIPFTLGANHAIHIRGRINGSDTLDLIFDTGASIAVLSDEGRKKGAVQKDGRTNTIGIQSISLANATVSYIDYRGRLKADGVVGYDAFEDKIVEINYDRGLLVIHEAIDTRELTKYQGLSLHWRGSAMFINIKLVGGETNAAFLGLFDTGSKFALSLTQNTCEQHQLYDRFPGLGSRTGKGVDGHPIRSTTVVVPTLQIAGYSLTAVPVDLEKPSSNAGLPFNIVGNEVLKRFNIFLDLRASKVYLAPNGNYNDRYARPFSWWLVLVATAVFAAILFLAIYVRRKGKTRDGKSIA